MRSPSTGSPSCRNGAFSTGLGPGLLLYEATRLFLRPGPDVGLVNPVRPERNQSLSAEFQSDCYTAATSAVDSAELTSTAELGTKRGSNYDEVQGGWSVSHKKIKPQASDGEEARNAVVTILSLPTELHRLIFSSIDDMVDVVSLGINKDPAFKCIRSQLECTKNTYFPQDQQWILRNLTTKQIVRSAAIALSPDDIHGPSIDILGFGDAVMSRIFWSTDSYGGMEYDPTNLTRGTWAGYCFDTTTLSRHEAETCEAEWSDASKVRRDIASIWGCRYGPNWRDVIRKEYHAEPNNR
ncbi:hypothetical protein F4801DRAFT_584775 [Xylaria longipes]|nr:hypothetical protein F4801DRAFT_584775 [Xylaria longipes]